MRSRDGLWACWRGSAGAFSKHDSLHFDNYPFSPPLDTRKKVIIGVAAEISVTSLIESRKYASLARGKMMCSNGLSCKCWSVGMAMHFPCTNTSSLQAMPLPRGKDLENASRLGCRYCSNVTIKSKPLADFATFRLGCSAY